MGLLAIMRALAAIEESIELEASVVADLKIPSGKVKKVHLVAPSAAETLGDIPCFMNWPDAGNEARMGDDREDHWSIQIDFFAQRDGTKGPETALAFFDRTWAVLDDQRLAAKRLGQTVDYFTLRAERPMVETLEWNGFGYPGFHIYLDLVAHEVSL